MTNLAKCRSCGAPVIWVTTLKGKRMPVDAEPHPNGNITLSSEGAHCPPEEGKDRYLSHFATCPNAGQHRKRS